MGDNTVQIRVATDLSSVEGAVNKTQQAIQRTIAESLKMQNASAAEAQAIYKELGIAGTQAAMEIQAAFGQTNQEIRKTGAAIPALRWSIQETASGGNSSIRSMFPVLSDLRQVTRAAMGAFAAAYVVEELGRTMAATREAADTWGGFNEAVQKGLADDIKDSDDALIHFRGLTTVLKISTGERLIAQTQLDILRAQAQKQALLDVQTWQKTTAEIVWAYFTMGLTLVPLIKNKIDLNEATAQESELNARLNAQLQDLSALQVRLHTEQAKTAKDREAAADREAHAIARRDADDARFVATTLKANIAGDVQWYQAEDRLLKSIEATNDALEKSRQAAANMDIEAVKVALDMDNWNGAMQRNQQLSRGAAGDQLQEDVTNTRHLSLARKELIGITQDLRLVEDAFKAAMHGEADALQGMTQSVGDVAGQFAQMIGGTKLAAEVKGAFDAALSIEYLAQFIASWGTDTAAGLASVQYGLAAAEMFKVAGAAGRAAALVVVAARTAPATAALGAARGADPEAATPAAAVRPERGAGPRST